MRTVDRRGKRLDDIAYLLQKECVVKVNSDDEEECLHQLKLAGAYLMPQYECVKDGVDDPTLLETTASSTPSPTATSASKAVDTTFHMDSYQFQPPYRGVAIAGIGCLPDVEVLSYPRVVEGRFLVFSDVCRASRRFLRAHEAARFEQLTKRVFTISPRYNDLDAELLPPDKFAVAFADDLGFRFHLGGSVDSSNPVAAFTLNLFRLYLATTVVTERLESGTCYLINQRRTVHRGLRIPNVDGNTLLRRRLLRFERGES